ncbi:50S ribosomal protein L6 [Arsenophonus endosymbiont of Aleurodicus dispersus]|uniref:50S ribosomal protein L6 n=1 Tax=Arsenophonus endosymbiont of Aleurodicus dispersus TaxID=235559 RepID=UPI000EAC0D1A|nr:50S ribosomal protein L6 [Arsenophonus endosymbiont of Aleurodicus dispersus]VAY02388.1 50S ribosomal protein L6 [Arsenophonus endosymbiont of Aleurodicus dispersus]
MFRLAKKPVIIPVGVEVKLDGQNISIKGKNGELTRTIHKAVEVKYVCNQLTFAQHQSFDDAWAKLGTTRSLLNAMVIGVTEGFTKKLQLIGVGYRAAIKDNIISLSLGYSHPLEYELPAGITAKCPSQTEIVLEGLDKQAIGQVVSELRAYRRPDPYKGKGVRCVDEIVRYKDAKKK